MRLVVAILVTACATLCGPSAYARSKHTNAPAPVAGQFDYYLLTLSWSPTCCKGHQEDKQQCGMQKHFGFVLHSLWPQYQAGKYPQTCSTDNRLTDEARSVGEDVFPSEKLIAHEWDKHGGTSPFAFAA